MHLDVTGRVRSRVAWHSKALLAIATVVCGLLASTATAARMIPEDKSISLELKQVPSNSSFAQYWFNSPHSSVSIKPCTAERRLLREMLTNESVYPEHFASVRLKITTTSRVVLRLVGARLVKTSTRPLIPSGATDLIKSAGDYQNNRASPFCFYDRRVTALISPRDEIEKSAAIFPPGRAVTNLKPFSLRDLFSDSSITSGDARPVLTLFPHQAVVAKLDLFVYGGNSLIPSRVAFVDDIKIQLVLLVKRLGERSEEMLTIESNPIRFIRFLSQASVG